MQVPFNDLRRVLASHDGALREAFERVTASGRFVLGDEVRRFEREFATFCGTTHCIGVASGSDALEIALRAAGVVAGDRVATVANAAMYATLAILAIGARPVHVDVDDATLTMSADALAAIAPGSLKAVIATHLYGRLADMRALLAAARRHGAAVIEDCAQAHGAMRDGVRAGAFGLAGCFSFYPTKNLGALGDGGAITTSDDGLAARVQALRQYGWSDKYCVTLAGGRNSRLDELQAALLRARLPFLDRENGRRRQIVNAYATRIRHAAIRTPPPAGDDNVAHLAVLRCGQRDALRDHLRRRGIGTDVHYPIADHRQPLLVAQAGDAREPSLPVTERACADVVSLPVFPALRDDEVDAVVDACNDWRC